MDWQWFLVVATVALAAGWLCWQFWPRAAGWRTTACSSCDQQVHTGLKSKPLVSIQLPDEDPRPVTAQMDGETGGGQR